MRSALSGLRRLLLALLFALFWWLLLSGSLRTGGAVLGLLAASGWSLGLVPVHSNRLLTGPRHRTGESAPRGFDVPDDQRSTDLGA